MRLLIPLLLLPLIYCQATFYPYGVDKGDQLIDKGWHATVLDVPIVFLETPQSEIFVSNNGIVSFGEQLQDNILPLQNISKSAVAVYYAAQKGGKTFFRATSSDRGLLQAISNNLKKEFPDDREFKAIQAVLVTWENKENSERKTGNTYQLALASDGSNSYATMLYKTLQWPSSEGRMAQSGFSHVDGRYQPNINSGTDTIVDLVNLSNTDGQGTFSFRISGASLEDPSQDDDYQYNEYDQDYDGEHREKVDCPPDPYRNQCPVGCNVLTDDRGCSLCVCAEPHSPQNVHIPENNDVEEEEEEEQESPHFAADLPQPRQEERISDELHPLDPRRNELNNPDMGREIDVPSAPAGRADVSCASGSTCHANAKCQDHAPGHCCTCDTGYYGNGKECLKKGDPQRISGGFEGVINGQRIEKTDLHTFITGSDGNAYTALSKVPANLGASMMLLSPIGSVMGWLFAEVNSHLVYNGFQLTGGLFNRTATVHIDSSVITINQHFSGRDIYHYFKANVFLTGTLPKLRDGAEVTFGDYDEEYRRESAGFVRSYSNMEVTINENGNKRKMPMTVDQQIHYAECSFKPFDKSEVVTLNVKRVHVTHDPVEGIVRYASRNYADVKRTTAADPRQQPQQQPSSPRRDPLRETSHDVCASGRHVCTLPNMQCRAVDPSYRCECLPGFQAERDVASAIGWKCTDINECERGDHTCDAQATCSNTEGAFRCQCKPGFTGDGHACMSEAAAQHHQQPHHAHGHNGHPAHEAPNHQPRNVPLTKGACTQHTQCHQWGECVFTPGNPTGQCKCRGWYTGDGVEHCGPPQREEQRQQPQQPQQPERPEQRQDHRAHHNANIPQNRGQPCGNNICDPNAECMPSPDGGSECVCRAGYNGDGIQCESLLDEDEHAGRRMQPAVVGAICRAHDECSENGACAYNAAVGFYQCSCKPPYVGDGVRCDAPGDGEIDIPLNTDEEAGCDVLRNCDPYADCVFEKTPRGGSYKCVCQPGYLGNGYMCSSAASAMELPALLPPVEEQGCDRLRNCHADAQCVYDSFNRKYACECNSGYIGDGKNCVQISGGSRTPDASRPQHCREQSDCHQNAHCIQDVSDDYVCECLPGYRGDGVRDCKVADQCTPADPRSCAQNAECVYGEHEGGYVCKCIQGFSGDGVQCRPHAAPTTCDRDPRLCHANAQCVYNHERQQYGCLCKPGSQGDGQNRCDPVETPRCTNCSTHANCVPTQSGGWRCQCSAGYIGSGVVCAPLTSCLDDRSICDGNAECVPGEGGHYVCNCRYGFHGNGRSCSPDSEFRTDTLLVARGMAIFQRGTHQDIPGKQLIVIPHHIAVGVDFDCQEERIVWSDISGHSIRSASLSGANQTSHFSDVLESPEGIAVDWSSRNVYYADSLKDEIGVVSMDGKYQKALVTEGLVNPRALAIDLQNKHLYYTDWHREHPIIGRVDLDGKNNQPFVQDDVHLPNGLTILPNRKELCWVDAGVHRLSCIGFDGRNRRTVYSNLNYPFGVTHVKENKFYWTDWKDNRIHSVGVYGDAYASMPISLGGSGKVYGISAIADHCSGSVSSCSINNGGCAYMCLPGREGVHCACPDNSEGLEGC